MDIARLWETIISVSERLNSNLLEILSDSDKNRVLDPPTIALCNFVIVYMVIWLLCWSAIDSHFDTRLNKI